MPDGLPGWESGRPGLGSDLIAVAGWEPDRYGVAGPGIQRPQRLPRGHLGGHLRGAGHGGVVITHKVEHSTWTHGCTQVNQLVRMILAAKVI